MNIIKVHILKVNIHKVPTKSLWGPKNVCLCRLFEWLWALFRTLSWIMCTLFGAWKGYKKLGDTIWDGTKTALSQHLKIWYIGCLNMYRYHVKALEGNYVLKSFHYNQLYLILVVLGQYLMIYITSLNVTNEWLCKDRRHQHIWELPMSCCIVQTDKTIIMHPPRGPKGRGIADRQRGGALVF